MIAVASSEDQIAACYEVMSQLRPHLAAGEFVSTVGELGRKYGFRLAFLTAGGTVRAVAGFRVAEWLGGGKYLEIEDLVAGEAERSKGFGGELFDWLVAYARRKDCDQLRLVSHVSRFGAHRFYLRKRMIIEAHYFSMKL